MRNHRGAPTDNERVEEEALAVLGSADFDDRRQLLEIVRRLLVAASFAQACVAYHPLRDRLIERAAWSLSVMP